MVYGQRPSLYVPYITGDSKVEVVDRSLKAREECIKILRFHLERAQNRMKVQVGNHRTEREYQLGDFVHVKLQTYRQIPVKLRTCHKLAVKYFGPFPIIARIGLVAYKLQLPSTSEIHPIFYISQLKKHVGAARVQGYMLEVTAEGVIKVESVVVLDRRLGKKDNHGVVFVIIQWANCPTWELYSDIEKRFLNFYLQASRQVYTQGLLSR